MNPAHSARKHANHLGISMTCFILLMVGSQRLLNELITHTFPTFAEHDTYIWLLSTVPLYLFALPITLLLLRKIPAERPATENSRVSFLGILVTVIACFGLMYIGSVVGNFLMTAVGLLRGVLPENPVYTVLRQTDLLPNLIASVIVAPIGEEFLFRRLLIDRTRRFGERTAILFSAAAFAAFHLNVYQFFYAFLLGLVFAYIYLKTGRLRNTIFLHALINLFGGVISMQLVQSIEPLLTAQSLDLSGIVNALPALLLYLSYTVFLLLASVSTILLGILFCRKLSFRDGIDTSAALSQSFGTILFFGCCAVLTLLIR